MLPHVVICHGVVTGLRVVLLLSDILAGPGLFDFLKEWHEVECTLAEVFAAANIMVVVVEDQWNIEFFADWEKVMDGPVLSSGNY